MNVTFKSDERSRVAQRQLPPYGTIELMAAGVDAVWRHLATGVLPVAKRLCRAAADAVADSAALASTRRDGE